MTASGMQNYHLHRRIREKIDTIQRMEDSDPAEALSGGEVFVVDALEYAVAKAKGMHTI